MMNWNKSRQTRFLLQTSGVCILIVFLIAPVSRSGMAWKEILHPLTARSSHEMTTDTARNRVILFGGDAADLGKTDETFEWNGDRWQIMSGPTESQPGGIINTDIAFMLENQKTYLFGGLIDSTATDEFWEWDDNEWTKILCDIIPASRHNHSICYDPDREKVVLFGGSDAMGGYFGDTWEWDGEEWELVDEGTGPIARAGHCMEFDPNLGKIILFGGQNDSYFRDFWSWDGQIWEEILVEGPKPVRRRSAAMRYLPEINKVVLFGGTYIFPGANLSDTWEWDGESWEWKMHEYHPDARIYFDMSYDPLNGELLLFGGLDDWDEYFGDFWSYDETGWHERDLPENPRDREYHAMAYDLVNDGILIIGGTSNSTNARNLLSDPYLFRDGAWFPIYTENPPPPRAVFSMVCVPGEGDLLYGGLRNINVLEDFWRWDGNEWTLIASNNEPGKRYRQSMTYDSHRDVVLMFGGLAEDGISNDIWEWDREDWTEIITKGESPNPRGSAGFAFDENRMKTVLFGGHDFYSFYNDTWEWDVDHWEYKEINGHKPSERTEMQMLYNPVRETVSLLYGNSYGTPLDDVWEWDGERWMEIETPEIPTSRSAYGLAQDSRQNYGFIYGGLNYRNQICDDTWMYYETVDMQVETDRPYYYPGDDFQAYLSFYNDGPASEEVVFVVLDVYGSYWFWPHWRPCPPYLDFERRTIESGSSEEMILNFTWPEGLGSGGPLYLHAICFEPDTNTRAIMDSWEFYYYE